MVLYYTDATGCPNVLYWEFLELGMLHGKGFEFDLMNYINQAWGYMPMTQHLGGRGWKNQEFKATLDYWELKPG